MKRLLFFIVVLCLFSACAANQAATDEAALSHLANELSIAQSSVASLQSDVDSLTLQNDSLNTELLQNTSAISELQANVTYLMNEVIILKNPNYAASTDDTDVSDAKTPKIVIIEDLQTMRDSLYSYALQLYQEGKHKESIEKFEEFISKLPNDTLANNAQYWIGENYYSMRSFPQALEAFQTTLTKYPKGSKAPDATLKVGYTYYAMGQSTKAKETLNNLIKNYSKSDSANLAKQTLAKWK